jgi:branched-chain amino acid transport system substrate-binding protein
MRILIMVALVIAVAAGCGTRLDDTEIVGALSPPQAQESQSGTAAAGTSSANSGEAESPTAGAPGAPATAGKGLSTTAPGTEAAASAHIGKPGGPAGRAAGSPVAKPSNRSTLVVGAAKPGASDAPAAAGRATKPLNRSTLVFGNIGPYSGVLGAVLVGNRNGIAAWVSSQNARGGLDGHPIQLNFGDDQADPATGLSLMRRMVENDKAMAFVANINIFGFDQYADYAKSKGVPFIGGDAVDPRWFTDPNAFPSTSPLSAQMEAGLQSLLNQGVSRLGMIYCIEVAKLCPYLNDLMMKSPVGKNITVDEQVSLVAPSYTSQCLRMQSAKVEAVFLLMDTAGAARFAQNCVTQGYRPKFMVLGLDATPEYPKIPVLAGSSLPGATVPVSETQIPSIAQYRQAMDRYLPGVGDSGMSGLGWVGGVILGRAGAHLSDHPTVQELLENLWTIKNDNLGGITVPLTFAKGKPSTAAHCVFIWGVKDGKFYAPLGPKPVC